VAKFRALEDRAFAPNNAAMSDRLPDEKIEHLRELCRKHGGDRIDP
jgi:hypothetical protein